MVATGGGQTVRTAAAVEREVESYDVTVKHIGRDGRPAVHAESTLFRFGAESGSPFLNPQVTDGVAKIRVPKGTYVANSTVYQDPDDVTKGADWMAQPKVSVTRATTLTFDARKAKPVKVTLPDAKAKGQLFAPDYVVETAGEAVTFGWLMDSAFTCARCTSARRLPASRSPSTGRAPGPRAPRPSTTSRSAARSSSSPPATTGSSPRRSSPR